MSTEIIVEVDRKEAVVQFGVRPEKVVNNGHHKYITLDSIRFETPRKFNKPTRREGWDCVGASI